MTPEQFAPKRPYEIFGFTEEELTRWRISDQRLEEILTTPDTKIHDIHLDSNNFGNFLFLTTTKGPAQERVRMTFWGLGYHELRERWILHEWFWYQSLVGSGDLADNFTAAEALAQLEERRELLQQYAEGSQQTELGEMFEIIADLTDDDAAMAEMQDLGFL